MKEIQSRKEFVEITPADGVAIDLRYATVNNFMNENVYGAFNKAYLHEKAASQLMSAIQYLKQSHPDYKLVIFDALRPRSVQYKLWDYVKGTDHEKYVANPDQGSMHNYGFAVDLSVLNEHGLEVDMGTVFDTFTELSQPQLEPELVKRGLISQENVDNRLILRSVMEKAGFIQLPTEWWHFDALPRSIVKSHSKIVE